MLNSVITFCLIWAIPILGFSPVNPPENDLGLKGAWELVEMNGEEIPDGNQTIRTFSDTYTMATTFNQEAKKFISSRGGPYSFDGTKVSLTIDYNTEDTAQVGKVYTYKIKLKDGMATVKAKTDAGEKVTTVWKRLDDGNAPLTGAWQITQRMGRDGEMREMKPGPRKTIKILSGTRFQWTAMNTATKEFMGCGGGNYTFEGGKYTENIEFFSRDSSRVGMSLTFDGKVEGDNWHHSGKSSRGRPIKEIWTRD
jgi:hypothetical protein